jgi:hypothetical protein
MTPTENIFAKVKAIYESIFDNEEEEDEIPMPEMDFEDFEEFNMDGEMHQLESDEFVSDSEDSEDWKEVDDLEIYKLVIAEYLERNGLETLDFDETPTTSHSCICTEVLHVRPQLFDSSSEDESD